MTTSPARNLSTASFSSNALRRALFRALHGRSPLLPLERQRQRLHLQKKSVYETTEWSNFKRFKTAAGDAKIDAPKPQP
jgi:hypothetical protein